MSEGNVADVVVCSECGRENNPTAAICAGCTLELKPAAPAPPPPPPPPAPQQACVNDACGLQIPAGRDACPHCGARQTRAEGPFVRAGAAKRLLGDEPLVIGREGDTVLAAALATLQNSDLISRRHCEVTLVGGEAHIRDLGSTNGTFVDGRRLEGRDAVKVEWGVEIRFGKSGPTMTIQCGDVSESGSAA